MKEDKIIQIERCESRIALEEEGLLALTESGKIYFLRAVFKPGETVNWREVTGIKETVKPTK